VKLALFEDHGAKNYLRLQAFHQKKKRILTGEFALKECSYSDMHNTLL